MNSASIDSDTSRGWLKSPRWVGRTGPVRRGSPVALICETTHRAGAPDHFRSPPSAFTLIEVLISLAVFAAAAVVLGATYLNVITNYHAALQRPEAESVATLLRAGLLSEPDRKKAGQGGELPLATGRTARWHATIEDTAIADLFEVTLEWEIAAPGAAGAGQGRQRLMLLRLDWSDPTVREKLRAQSRQRLAERKF